MVSYSIRKAQPNDASGLTNLLLEIDSFQHHFESLTPQATEARVSQQFQACLADQSHSIYVAEGEDAQILGYVSVHWQPYLFLPGPEGFISELFIHQLARGQGIGTALLETVKQEAVERGCSRLALINMRQRESYQRGFYTQRGWAERPEAVNFVLRLAPGR
jgi:GNAT superfamily N-acetyltransferase